MPRFIIIADDLTGANDTGVQFAKLGFQTVSLLDLSQQQYVRDAEVLVFNAETRSLEAEDAYKTIKAITSHLPLREAACVYKKIDSTMRGNIGAEINALMDQDFFDLAVVVPAYPKGSRLTIGGYHLVHQVLLEDTEFARDPKCPVEQSYLPELLASQTDKKVGHIDLRQIRGAREEMVGNIMSRVSDDQQVIVFDTATQEDLQTIASAVLQSGLRVLWVGSAGLAQSLADLWMVDSHITVDDSLKPLVSESESSIFVLAGSVSAVTQQQIKQLAQNSLYRVVTADPIGLLEKKLKDHEWGKLTKQMLAVLGEGCNPILTTNSSESVRQAVVQWGSMNGKDSFYIGNFIAEQMGKLAAYVISQHRFGGVIATGGDMAFRLCEHLGTKALRILDEVEPGIPISQIMGGMGEGLPIVTKAGAFGNPNSFVNAVNKINTYNIKS